MNNKVLIKLNIPEISEYYDVFIPVNEMVWKIKKMLIKCINDINNMETDNKKEYILMKKDSSRIYINNELIVDTDIRNASELILVSK